MKKQLLNELLGDYKELGKKSIEELEQEYIRLNSKNIYNDLYHKMELVITQGIRALPELELDLDYILKDHLIPEEEREGVFYIVDNFYYYIRSLPLNIVFNNDLRFYIIDWIEYLREDGIVSNNLAENIDFDFIYPDKLR